MTSPSDELKAAATRLRNLATAATPGPWEQTGIGDYGWNVTFGHTTAGVETEDSDQGRADADYIATMGPNVGLRLADWLTSWDGADIDEYAAMPDDLRHALLIARVINTGGQP
ncbi:hypothetical protein AB0M61_01740 [Streptomyces sp. NPDC051642]|uniref:hypothetical protein n=1 Tax=Streptomyces sp. NPDC051642 TaxID=3154646 RepID=UPI00343C149F